MKKDTQFSEESMASESKEAPRTNRVKSADPSPDFNQFDPLITADPQKYTYRVGVKLEIVAEIFEEIRRFIDDEVEKRPLMHPYLEIRDFESSKFHHIKELLDEVHVQNVRKGNATPNEVIDRELEEFFANQKKRFTVK